MDITRQLDNGENKLLSICIPTYNRAEYLRKTLDSIVNQEGFVEHCEIVISDNGSSDNTEEVVKKFVSLYSNIRYYRNETNIGPDSNFLKVMDFALGKYIKLHGDKVCFCKTGLTRLIGYLEKTEVSTVFLLNCQNGLREKGMINCDSFDEFVDKVSYWSTWMNGIILRNNDYKNLEDKERAMGSFLIQTDIMFRIVSKNPISQVLNERLLFEQPIEAKGGYNIFKVFVDNYLSLYDEYLNRGLLTQRTYKKEKIKLLRFFVFPWYTETVLRKRYKFELTRANKIIIRHYKTYIQLYSFPMYILIRAMHKINTLLCRISFILSIESYIKVKLISGKWRKQNNHNNTSIGNIPKESLSVFSLDKVSVGKMSYGALNIHFFGASNEELKIGHFVSIASDVKFIMGGNHNIKTFSTYPFKAVVLHMGNEAWSKGPIIIEDDVWIGTNALILSGVTIGKGSIIGAGAVVSKDIPPYAIVVGNPAKVIKYRFDDSLRSKLMGFDFEKIDINFVNRNLDRLYADLNDDVLLSIVTNYK